MNNNLVLFFDGCHKIYYAERTDSDTIKKMQGYGYEVIDGDFDTNLSRMWKNSCYLRFVSPANLDFSLPHIPQSEKVGLREFSKKLRDYFASEPVAQSTSQAS